MVKLVALASVLVLGLSLGVAALFAASAPSFAAVCTVQDVEGKTLAAAKGTIVRANCRVGMIRRAYSKTVKRGRVISETPKPGTVLPNRGKVNLVVSRGRKPS